MEIRLQKYIADSGYCSRRRAEELIREKRVQVNGKLALLGMKVGDEDLIIVEGKKIKMKKKPFTYILLNKPKGYSSTSAKIEGEKNLFSLVPSEERLFIVGRLDKKSRGLVILTNDGSFAYKLTHPSFQYEKEYRVELSREVGRDIITKLIAGVNIGEKSKAKMKLVEKIGPKRYKVILTEGKKRQIRRSFELFGRSVTDLQRVRIDEYRLGRLKEGSWKRFKID